MNSLHMNGLRGPHTLWVPEVLGGVVLMVYAIVVGSVVGVGWGAAFVLYGLITAAEN